LNRIDLKGRYLYNSRPSKFAKASMKRRNSLIIVLIASSMGLLIILQFLWLRSAYRDAANNFRKETSGLFRTTIFSMHDSLIERSIQPMKGDSATIKILTNRMRYAGAPFDNHDDSVFRSDNIERLERREARIDVFFSSDQEDSLGKVLPPIVRRIQKDKYPQSFIIKIGPDSLKKDSIKKEFTKVLHVAGIDLPFRIYSFAGERIPKEARHIKEKYSTERVRLNPMHEYAVSFSGTDSLLLKQITPQILFSTFLTLLTIGSFYVLYRSLRSQQKLMDLKNDFISNVTHELKTPVATVSVALEALKNFNALNNPQRTAEYLDIAQSELNRLTLMTDKILKTSVFESKGVELKFERFDLDQLTQQILSSMKLVFEKRKIKLTYERTGVDFTLDGSQEHLINVLYNLVDNALKYSSEGSMLSLAITEHEKTLLLSVKDQGIGIPPEYQKKIFEKFFRVPSGDVHNTKGYGLGLSYVAGVVKSHHGTITVESEAGEGSTFFISLPKNHEN
jgi:two-component system, OmpR family, phosphate regulon sensor histidine kinase PhoR